MTFIGKKKKKRPLNPISLAAKNNLISCSMITFFTTLLSATNPIRLSRVCPSSQTMGQTLLLAKPNPCQFSPCNQINLVNPSPIYIYIIISQLTHGPWGIRPTIKCSMGRLPFSRHKLGTMALLDLMDRIPPQTSGPSMMMCSSICMREQQQQQQGWYQNKRQCWGHCLHLAFRKDW